MLIMVKGSNCCIYILYNNTTIVFCRPVGTQVGKVVASRWWCITLFSMQNEAPRPLSSRNFIYTYCNVALFKLTLSFNCFVRNVFDGVRFSDTMLFPCYPKRQCFFMKDLTSRTKINNTIQHCGVLPCCGKNSPAL